jgi:hypothetical protein
MSEDISKLADKLTRNMVKTMTWWCSKEGVVHADVDAGTKRALVKRGLAVWETASVPLCVELTPLGRQVREVLLVQQKVEEAARNQRVAQEEAAKWKFREAGYKDGYRVGQAECVTDLNRAMYGTDTWPDRPLDSVWEHLIGLVRKHFQPGAAPVSARPEGDEW